MKTVRVVAAIIIRDGKVFATQRGYGQWQGWWEFPGGKIEAGECPQEALVREIREELEAEIQVGELIETIEWDYPDFHLTGSCLIFKKGEPYKKVSTQTAEEEFFKEIRLLLDGE